MKLLRIKEAAAQLEISARQLRAQIAEGYLATIRTGKSPRSDRIHPDDLGEYVAKCRSTREGINGMRTSGIKVDRLSASLSAVCELLGHSTVAITKDLYGHLEHSHLEAAVKLLDDI